MLVLGVLLAMVLLVVCGFAPGFFLVRHLRWSPLEKLCGSVGASFGLLYLVLWALYLVAPAGTEIPRWALALVSGAAVVLGFVARRDIVRLFSSFRVRQALAGFSFLLIWTFFLLGIIRNFSGADWFGDWAEQFQRTLFFLHHFPSHSPILMAPALSSRPPAMNQLAAFFLGQTGDRFEIFQLIFAFLNLLVFLPCCLILPALVGPRRIFARPLVALFALNPVVMQNVTYTWTKAFTAFYVILGLWFYLAGWRKNDRLRMTAAFVALSIGLLVHYSAGPYVLFLTLHYLTRVFPKRSRRWHEIATIAAVCGLLLVTWFGWSVAVFGTRGTFASNTSVTLAPRDSKTNLVKITGNVFDSIVPVIIRDDSLLDEFNHQGLMGTIRDDAFIFYQVNLPFSMGLIGGPLILWLLYRALFRRFPPGAQRSFWLAMIPFCVVVGIATVGERGPLGKAHLTLLPMEILGLCLLAATFPLRRAFLALVVAGCLIDFSFGILLQAHVESLENLPQRTVFLSLSEMGSAPPTSAPGAVSLSTASWNNWIVKHQYAQLTELSRTLQLETASDRAQLAGMLRGDEVYWHGWYARNGGSIGFLGDRFAGESGRGTTILTCILVVIALVIAVQLLLASTPSVAGTGPGLLLFKGAARPDPVRVLDDRAHPLTDEPGATSISPDGAANERSGQKNKQEETVAHTVHGEE
jgi:hypothetical protein